MTCVVRSVASKWGSSIVASGWALPIAVAAGMLGGSASTAVPLAAQQAAEAREALRAGEYEDAIDGFRDVLRGEPAAAGARIGLIEALLATGAYEDAVRTGEDAPDPTAVANATGEALLRVGRLDEAEAAFSAAAAAGGPWALTAEANLAALEFRTGRVDEATARFDRFIDVYNGTNGGLSALDLVAVGRAVEFLGRTEPNLFQDALRAYDEAARSDPTWNQPPIRTGTLFLDKYDSPSAKTEFEKVLQRNPDDPAALMGMAESYVFDGTSQSTQALERVLEVDPNHVEARSLLAMQFLTKEGYDEAREQAERALEVDPSSLEALTALAGVHLLLDEPAEFERVRERALAINPRYAGLDVALADLSVKTRRYHQATERAAAAVELDSAAWEAWGLLGMNQLRIGEIDAGRATMERAFEGDPFNPWFKNSLDLLDTFGQFEIHPTEHFELFLHGSEAELLANYLAPIAEEAYDSLSRRYQVEPALPVRAELFPSHADFSVRTLGEAGLGALGVSFGKVLVMDAPSARQLGDYNWASVFWHELAHTFHLAKSDGRVPRWFSEGLAVHEQRKARPGWGHQPSLGFLQALRDDRLKAVSELDDGFMRPDYPEQVGFSYLQASIVFEMIEDRHGFDVIRRMLDGYRDGATTDEMVGSVLQTTAEALDQEFDDFIRAKYASPLAGLEQLGEAPPPGADIDPLRTYARAHPGDLLTRLRLGVLLFRADRFDEAEEEFRAALRIFPEYGGPDSPYWFLAQIHRERGEIEQAEAALARLNELSESNYEALMQQADLLDELGRPEASAAALDRAVQIWPYDMEVHRRLADLHASLGQSEGVVRERSAVVALDPPDRAEALYQLAVAQYDAGDAGAARRSILGALEIAPNYEDALEFLLLLRGTGS